MTIDAAPEDTEISVTATRSLFAGIVLLMMGNGLNSAVLGIRSSAENFSLFTSALIMAFYFIGFFLGSLYAVRFVTGVGHIRVFAALASTASSAVLIHSVWINPVAWILMRSVFGACMAGLYVVIESWLTDASTPANRGRMLATYMVVTMGGMGIGQYMINLGDISGYALFITASVLVSLSLVPIALSASSTPPFRIPSPMSFKDLVAVVPTGVIGSFWVGASHGTMIGLGAVYGATIGQSTTWIAAFVTAPLLGTLVSQHLVGVLADRYPRRAVLFGLAALAGSVAAVQIFISPGNTASIAMMFILGSASFPLYSVVIAYATDWVRPDQIVGTSSALVRTNGAGAIVGPVAAAVLMALGGPRWFFGILTVTHLLIAAYVAYRVIVADPLPLERQRRYIVFPARAGATATAMLSRRRGRSRTRPGTNANASPTPEPKAPKEIR